MMSPIDKIGTDEKAAESKTLPKNSAFFKLVHFATSSQYLFNQNLKWRGTFVVASEKTHGKWSIANCLLALARKKRKWDVESPLLGVATPPPPVIPSVPIPPPFPAPDPVQAAQQAAQRLAAVGSSAPSLKPQPLGSV